jgi:hypothetical protein
VTGNLFFMLKAIFIIKSWDLKTSLLLLHDLHALHGKKSCAFDFTGFTISEIQSQE